MNNKRKASFLLEMLPNIREEKKPKIEHFENEMLQKNEIQQSSENEEEQSQDSLKLPENQISQDLSSTNISIFSF